MPVEKRGRFVYSSREQLNRRFGRESAGEPLHIANEHPVPSPTTLAFTDWAADFQFDRTFPSLKNDVLSFRGT